MKFPQMSQKSKLQEKAILFSGIASSLHPSVISCDHLKDSLNVFNKEGILTTREGFLKTSQTNLVDFSFTTSREKVFYADFPFNYFYGFDTLAVLAREELFANTCLDFFVLDKNGNHKKLFYHEIIAANGYATFKVENAVFIKSTAVQGSGLFFILPLERTNLKTGEVTKELRIFEFSNNYDKLINVDTSKFYCPLIMKHGHGDHYLLNIDNPVKDTQYPEGVNLLNGAFEADFSTDGYSDTFRLPLSIKSSTHVVIHLYTSEKTYRSFTIPASSNSCTPDQLGEATIYFTVDRANGIIRAMSESGLYVLPRYRQHNSLRIFAYTNTDDTAYSIFSHGTKPIYFDDRIFLPSGNKTCNKVFYSGKNQHLYFSAENSFSVGDDENNVTVLSKQGKYVIAFKSKEVYRITLSSSETIDKNTVIDNDLIKKMPSPDKKIVRINDCIGCDCPETVKNCSNRLVWYHSDGGVYTLYGSNNYTEGSVYELSGEIKDKLLSLSDEDNQNIKAVEIHGRYALATNKSIFIMDSLISGFSYLLGHKPADKKYSGPSWFYWETPYNTKLISWFARKGISYFIMADDNSRNFYISTLSGKVDTVYEKETLKSFHPDFSITTPLMGDSRKFADKMYLHLYLEHSAVATVYDINGKTLKMPIVPYGKFIHLNLPFNFKKGKVGLKLSGKGSFALDDISCFVKE